MSGGCIELGAVPLDVERGGLDPDGFDDRRLIAARMPRGEEELQALMLLAERDNLPGAPLAERPEAAQRRDGR